ncbi:hypothetical protein KKD19_07210 [Patescibacteria group bacterium]|nr:hypothetical protein [Patescibacteria group bacterium]MBU4512989.1 hypothetical protein [Patescibacteria group bacterium]MCG2693026.1 hypothetical protein [Candidatus Parcubacteria bacterium]
MKPLVYLAGPILGTSYKECTGWREGVAEQLAIAGIATASPMRGKDFLKKELKIGSKASRCFLESHPLSTRKGTVCRDRFDTSRCDVLFVNFLEAKRVSIGTVMEIAWADMLRKPIIVIMEENNIHRHGMLEEVTGFIVQTLGEGVELTKAILCTNLPS